MCLINFQLGVHPHYKLIVAANRDEFYERPTEPAHFWNDEPNLLAGRDLRGMGTWLGITKEGRFAALTNIRDPKDKLNNKKTRGEIITRYLTGSYSPEAFLNRLIEEKDDYAGFNLLIGNPEQLLYFDNRRAEPITVEAGTHGLSNEFLNTPWPKVIKGKRLLKEYTEDNEIIRPESLFDILENAEEAPDSELPHTGVGIEFERKLSPLFIKTPNYGTRAATVLLIDRQNHVTFNERTYIAGETAEERTFNFKIE